MALMFFPYTHGKCLVVGLSTDTKPINLSDNSIFIETDRNKIYKNTGSNWVSLERHGEFDSISEDTFNVVFETALPQPYTVHVEINDPTVTTLPRTVYILNKTDQGFTIKLSGGITGLVMWCAKKV